MAKTTSFGTITVDAVNPDTYKPSIDQAQLRQVVTTEYTSTIGNSNSDLLFPQRDFNLEPNKSYPSTRITWIPVPKGTTPEQVINSLKSKPNARIYRIISHNIVDCLSEEQLAGIELGYNTLEGYAEKLVVKDRNGQPIEGITQYSQNFFSATGKEDIDMRSEGAIQELLVDTQPASNVEGIAA